jgi:hypothetical protein
MVVEVGFVVSFTKRPGQDRLVYLGRVEGLFGLFSECGQRGGAVCVGDGV